MMAFEMLEKGRAGNQPLGSWEISIGKKSIGFGYSVLDAITEAGDYIEIYLDRKNRRIGFNRENNNF